MARVNVTHRYNSGNARALLQPGGGIHRDMRKRAIRVQTAAKRRIAAPPRRIDTGRLRNFIQIVEIPRGGVIVQRIGTDVEYAIFVHEGTRPHIIRPRNASVLAWRGPTGMVFARSVNHPGMAANPFLRDGLHEGFRD